MSNAHFGNQRFVSWARHGAIEALENGLCADAATAAHMGFEYACRQAEHGGCGMGVATIRNAFRKREAVLATIESQVEQVVAHSIGRALQRMINPPAPITIGMMRIV